MIPTYAEYIKAKNRQEELHNEIGEYLKIDGMKSYVDKNAPDGTQKKYEEMISYTPIVGVGDLYYV